MSNQNNIGYYQPHSNRHHTIHSFDASSFHYIRPTMLLPPGYGEKRDFGFCVVDPLTHELEDHCIGGKAQLFSDIVGDNGIPRCICVSDYDMAKGCNTARDSYC